METRKRIQNYGMGTMDYIHVNRYNTPKMTHESIIPRLERDKKDGIGAMLTSNDIKELLQEVKEKDIEIKNAKKTIELDDALRTEYHREIQELEAKIKELEARIEDLNDKK